MRISDWSSDVCSSDLSGELGAAGILNFQRDFPNAEGWGGTLNLTEELWTRNFAAPGGRSVDIPFKHRIGASYSQSFGEETGRASCRERVCLYVYISVGAVSLKKKK